MPSFTPPTYEESFLPEPEAVKAGVTGIMRHIQFPVGYAVLITGGVASTFPGLATVTEDQIQAADAGSGAAGKAYFHHGQTFTITAGEKTILDAAGYTTVP